MTRKYYPMGLHIFFLVFLLVPGAYAQPEEYPADLSYSDESWVKSLEALKASMNQLVRQNDLLKEEIKALKKRKTELKGELDKLTSEKSKLSIEPGRLQDIIEQKTKEEITLEREIDDSVKKLNSLKEEKRYLEQDRVDEHNNEQALKEEVTRFQKDVAALEAQTDQVTRENQRQLNDLKEQEKGIRSLLEKSKNEQSKLDAELSKLKDRFAVPEQEKKSLQEEQEHLQGELIEVNPQIQSHLEEKGKLEKGVQEKKGVQQARISELSQAIDQIETQQKELNDELFRLKREVQPGMVRKMTEEEKQLRGSLSSLREENAFLQEEVVSLSAVIESLKKEKAMVESLIGSGKIGE